MFGCCSTYIDMEKDIVQSKTKSRTSDNCLYGVFPKNGPRNDQKYFCAPCDRYDVGDSLNKYFPKRTK